MADTLELSVRYVGQGLPVLIVHGWSMAGFAEAHDLEPIFTQMSQYRRMYIDLPGMGNSPIGSNKNLDSMLESVSRFVEKNVLPSKFLLIGSSCGAYLARALAHRYADAVEGLFLRVPLVEPVSSKRDIDPFTPAISDETHLSSIPSADRELLGNIPVQTPDYIEKSKRRWKDIVLPAIDAADSLSLASIRDDPNLYKLTAPLHSVTAPFSKPTLIVTGRQDADVGYRDAWPLVACYPRATFATLDRADHGLPVDETDLFQSLVRNWLWRVEELRKFLVIKDQN